MTKPEAAAGAMAPESVSCSDRDGMRAAANAAGKTEIVKPTLEVVYDAA